MAAYGSAKRQCSRVHSPTTCRKTRTKHAASAAWCARGGAGLNDWWSAARRALPLRDLAILFRDGLREEGCLLPLDERGPPTGGRGLGAGPDHVEPARELAHRPAIEREGAREGLLVDGGARGAVDSSLERDVARSERRGVAL